MKNISKNKYYELSYDNVRNCIFWKMKGFWSSMSVAPDFDKDWDTIQSLVKPGFVIYADLSTMTVLVSDVEEKNDERQAKLMQAGCKKVACIISEPNTRIFLNNVLKKSGMEKVVKYCSNKEEALEFLNFLSHK